jgi:hypothetical protein
LDLFIKIKQVTENEHTNKSIPKAGHSQNDENME